MALHTAIMAAGAALGHNSNAGVYRLRGMLSQIVPLLTNSNDDVFEARYERTVTCQVDNIDLEVSDIPLHLALKNYMPSNVITLLLGAGKKLLLAHTGSDNRGYDQGDLLVHLALKASHTLVCVSALIDDAAEVLRMQNHRGDCPLHTVLRRTALRHGFKTTDLHVPVVLYLLERGLAAHTGFLLLRGHGDDLALHVAVRNHAPEAVVASLVTADPRALLIANGHDEEDRLALQGMLPMHLALHIKTTPSLAIMRWLLDDAMVVLTTKNLAGKLPVQLALSKGEMSTEVIGFLLSGVSDPPVVACMPDGTDLRLWHEFPDGSPDNTALHIALRKNASINILRLLIDPLGLVLCEKNAQDNMPLHTLPRRNTCRLKS